MSALDRFVSVEDFETEARRTMDPAAFDYYTGGAGNEATLADNLAAFRRVSFRPRMLAGTAHVSTAVTVFGTPLSAPLALAPAAFNALGHPDGELAVARAAGPRGTLFCASTITSFPLEDIAAVASGPRWFQLYVYRDREVTRDLIARAEAAGYSALVLTVDTPRLGRRPRDLRNRFSLPAHVRIRNLERYAETSATGWSTASSFTEYVHRFIDPSLTWNAVTWLRSLTRLPIVIKGVLTADDADRAFEHAATAVLVSNHGGRQLDGAIATMDALPDIVTRVAARGPVFLDGGIRCGADVWKALCAGAALAFVGRPYLWALASAGEAGVGRLIELLQADLELTMALCGCTSVADATPALLYRANRRGDAVV